MSQAPKYGPMAETDLPAVTRLIVHAFAGTEEGTQQWLEFAGHDNIRVLRVDGSGRECAGSLPAPESPPVSCLLRVPMGQFFGGASVRMLGVAGVGVAPESRGKGYAKRMMEECIREAAREGFPLSVLYPSTQALYRSVGYEQAGHRMTARLPIAQIDVRERGPEVEVLGEEDWPAVKACYARFAPRFDGMVDRGPYVWGRVAKQHDTRFKGFGIRGRSGILDGYVFLAQKRKDTSRQEIAVQDLAFNTPEAGRRLLRFFADFGTMGDDVVFPAGPSHPSLMMLPLQKYKFEFNHYWMLRVVNVEHALRDRGYPHAVNAEVHLELRDELVPENHGRFVLRVERGQGHVSRGGRGEVRMGIRSLAAMYTGHMTPTGLRLAGMVEGEEPALAAAAVVFGGGAPWMTDFF